MKKKEEILPSDKWSIEKMYPSIEMWMEDYLSLKPKDEKSKFGNLLSYKDKLNTSVNTLKKCLDLNFTYLRKLEKLYTYAHLFLDQDLRDDKAKNLMGLISNLYLDFQTSMSWLDTEILQIDEKILNEYLKNDELLDYRGYLKKLLDLKKHTLSIEEEKILARSSDILDVTKVVFSSFNNADLKFGQVVDSKNNKYQLTNATYLVYLKSEDRILRKNAFEELHQKYLDFENSLTELFYGEIKNAFFVAETRNYSSSLQAALFPNSIDLRVYYNLINSVRKNIKSLHKFVALRKKVLKLDKVHFYDIYVPLAKKVDWKMNYNDAKKIVLESVKPLGNSYFELLQKGLNENRWVDVYEVKGKRSGAYSSGCYDSYPYILLNYEGELNDVITLAHEAGHSMHTKLANNSQTYVNSRYPIFLAEIASTFNEQLLLDLLLKNAKNEDEKNFFINNMIDRINATLFRQSLFAEFELKMHELHQKKIPLTPNLIKSTYLELYKFYYGNDFEVDDLLQIEWARIPHFYTPFYVYQYAIGISIALFAFNKIKEDKSYIDKYLSILKKGSVDYPINILKEAAIDISKPTCIEEAIQYFDNLLDQLKL